MIKRTVKIEREAGSLWVIVILYLLIYSWIINPVGEFIVPLFQLSHRINIKSLEEVNIDNFIQSLFHIF